MTEWLDGFEIVTFPQSPGGDFTEPITKVGWHCTVGWCAQHAFNVYANAPGLGVCPHITAEYAGTDGGRDLTRHIRKRGIQHVPLNKASYAFERGNAQHPCHIQTNRAGVIQIERVGFPTDEVTDDEHRWLGEEILAPILAACPLIPSSVFQGLARMTEDEFVAWPGGQFRHANCPCQPQGHYDPPELDLDLILHFALEKLTPKGSNTNMVRLLVTDDPAGAQLTLGVGTLAWISNPTVSPIFDQAKVPTVNVTVAQVHELLTSHVGIGAAPTWGALVDAW